MGLTTSLLGLGIGAAGVAMNSYSSYQQAQAQNEAAAWNARIMDDKAANMDLLADDALQRGESAASVQQLRARQERAATTSAYAASGVDVNSGSPVDVVADMAAWQEYDRQQIIANSEREAWGYQSEANTMRQQAQMTRATKQNPWGAAAATGLTGATGLWNQYARY